MAMKWIAVLMDEHAISCLQDMEGARYQYRIVADDSVAFGKLMTRGFRVHELDLENPKDGLPK